MVTGASRGVGRAISKALAAAGVEVVGTSRNADRVDWPEGVSGVTFDCSTASSVESSWRAAGFDQSGFDIVVSNAGSGAFGSFRDEDFENWEDQIQLMLLGAMKVSQLVLSSWTPANPGVLVQIGSLATEYPIPYMSGYNAAKAGLAAFCESIRLETDPRIARVVELRLGDVATRFNDHVKGAPKDPRQKDAWEAMCQHVEEGPEPEIVAKRLLKALSRDQVGIIRTGSFFQAIVGSLFARFLSSSLKAKLNCYYYRISNY